MDRYRLGIQLDFITEIGIASCSVLEKGGKERKDEKGGRIVEKV